jgi:hypothetical protein
MSSEPKLGPYKIQRQSVRDELKRFYKSKRKEDAEVGRRINELTQVWRMAEKGYEVKDGKTSIKTTPEAELALAELRDIRSEPRFRETFPSFSKFVEFVRKHSITLEDLRADD